MHVEADSPDRRNCFGMATATFYALAPHFFTWQNWTGHLFDEENKCWWKAQSSLPPSLWNKLSKNRGNLFFHDCSREGQPSHFVWYVNFWRLWKYFYDQSMWMSRIVLSCLLICFSTTHKRFQHQTSIFFKNCFQIFWKLLCLIFDVSLGLCYCLWIWLNCVLMMTGVYYL